jgi:hypothetical protein
VSSQILGWLCCVSDDSWSPGDSVPRVSRFLHALERQYGTLEIDILEWRVGLGQSNSIFHARENHAIVDDIAIFILCTLEYSRAIYTNDGGRLAAEVRNLQL